MKKKVVFAFQLILVLALCFLAIFSVSWAMENVVYDGKAYNPFMTQSTGDEAEIVSFGTGSVLIPCRIDNKPVTAIGESAFKYSVFSEAVIPSTVKRIGASAFYGCKSLESVDIKEGVCEIADESFRGCSALREVTVPQSVTSIGRNVFAECDNVVLRVKENSTAHSYSLENGLRFSLM